MKYILLLTVLLLFSCEDGNEEITNSPTRHYIDLRGDDYEIETFTHEDCEYIAIEGYRRGFCAHKGNCKNPIHYKNIVTVYDTVTYKLIIDDGQNKTD